MMLDWRRELDEYKAKRLDDFTAYWTSLTGYVLTPTGEKHFRRLVNSRKRFTDQEFLDAMSLAAEQYLVRGDDGEITQSSAEEAFGKIGGILHVGREAGENPEIHDLYYVRGILNRRCSWLPNDAMEQLRIAHKDGVSVLQLTSAAKNANSWTQFDDALTELLNDPAEVDSEERAADPVKSAHDQWAEFLLAKFDASSEQASVLAGFLERCPSYAVSSAFDSWQGIEPTLAQALSNVVRSRAPALHAHMDLGVLNELFIRELPRDWVKPFLYYAAYFDFHTLSLEGVIAEDFYRQLTDAELVLLQSPPREYGEELLRRSLVNRAARTLLREALKIRGIDQASDRARSICRLYGAQSALDLAGYLKEEGHASWEHVLGMVSNLLGLPTDSLRTEGDADEYMGLFHGYDAQFMAVLKRNGTVEYRSVPNWLAYEALF